MSKRKHVWRAAARACIAATGLALAAAATHDGAAARIAAGPRVKVAASASRIAAAQGERVDIRLRSLTTRATGNLTVEASESGGRVRLTALNLPDPRTVAADARAYVVWAVSGGRIVRLGELRRDERGNGGLAFDSPVGFEHYGVIVTAESSAEVERPGDPVLTTRADEAAALYPSKSADDAGANTAKTTNTTDASNTANTPSASNTANTSGTADASSSGGASSSAVTNASTAPDVPAPPTPAAPRARTRRVAGDFYSEVEDALVAGGGGRIIELEGDATAPHARGAARATQRESRAYVRANFRGVPLPSAVGAGVYVLWGVIPDGRIVYMGSLPATEDLNRAEVYVRVAGFDADDYTLFVTAEHRRPAPSPEGRRLLKPKEAGFIK
jgi:hypothetical protein